MDKDYTIHRLTRYFNNRKDISAAYLFGSMASGVARTQSDVDIAVLFSIAMDLYTRFDLRLQIAVDLEQMLCRDVDVVDLESADLFFTHKIMEQRMILSSNDTQRRVAFEVERRRMFLDRLPFYEFYYQCAMQRLEGLGQNGR
jgi:predicted nucleotidyltransferase